MKKMFQKVMAILMSGVLGSIAVGGYAASARDQYRIVAIPDTTYYDDYMFEDFYAMSDEEFEAVCDECHTSEVVDNCDTEVTGYFATGITSMTYLPYFRFFLWFDSSEDSLAFLEKCGLSDFFKYYLYKKM